MTPSLFGGGARVAAMITARSTVRGRPGRRLGGERAEGQVNPAGAIGHCDVHPGSLSAEHAAAYGPRR